MSKRFGLVFLFPLICSACLSKPAARIEETPFFLSAPGDNGLVFIGIAGRRSNPDETLQLALESAAQRLVIFYGVSGEYFSELNIGSGAFDYTHNTVTALHFDREGVGQRVDSLQFDAATDTMEIENALMVRTTYQGALPVPVNFRPAYGRPDRKPDWVDNPPMEIEGYEVGVGFSGRRSSIADAFLVSYNNAIFAIIRNVSASFSGGDLNYQGFGVFDYRTSSDNVMYAAASLENFYVLDMWIDPNNKSVWTLAIASKKGF